jgi:thiol-disulfide isomerase/thioredoxin
LKHSTNRCIAAALLATLVSALAAAAPAAGDQPPAYLGKTLEDDDVVLTEHLGKAVVVSYWATWCGYCLKELPILSNIQRAAGKDHMVVIAVNTEKRDVFRKVARVLKPLEIQLAYDPGAKAQQAYGVNGIPHMVIIGRDGKIDSVFRGYSEESLDQIVAAINRATGAAAAK